MARSIRRNTERKPARRVGRWLLALAALLVAACSKAPPAGDVLDEAKLAGRTAASFPHASEDYFRDMDGALALTPQEIAGRNMWIVWTGGNDRLWDRMTMATFGAMDLLKAISSHPSQGYSRNTRWDYLGLVNEPCFDNPAGPDPKHRGLWLDQRPGRCPPPPLGLPRKLGFVAIA